MWFTDHYVVVVFLTFTPNDTPFGYEPYEKYQKYKNKNAFGIGLGTNFHLKFRSKNNSPFNEIIIDYLMSENICW